MDTNEFIVFKNRIYNLIANEGIENTLIQLKGDISPNSGKHFILLQFEARLKNHKKDKMLGILSHEQSELSINKIHNDLLIYIDSLISQDIISKTTPVFEKINSKRVNIKDLIRKNKNQHVCHLSSINEVIGDKIINKIGIKNRR